MGCIQCGFFDVPNITAYSAIVKRILHPMIRIIDGMVKYSNSKYGLYV